MLSQVKQSLYETLERLDDEQVRLILAFATSLQEQSKKSLTLERLAQDPAFKVPTQDPPVFPVVEPIQGDGISASRLLIEDRR